MSSSPKLKLKPKKPTKKELRKAKEAKLQAEIEKETTEALITPDMTLYYGDCLEEMAKKQQEAANKRR